MGYIDEIIWFVIDIMKICLFRGMYYILILKGLYDNFGVNIFIVFNVINVLIRFF